MFHPLGFPSVCALLVLLATQATAEEPKSESAILRAELAKTKSELEALKKEHAKTKADLESLQAQVWKVMGPPKFVPTVEVQTELLKRWNAIAKVQTFEMTRNDKSSYTSDFLWKEFDNFPHPTFRGEGSPESYGAFVQLLVEFLQKGDNFDYIAKHGLFTTDLPTTVPGCSLKGPGWSFAAFARDFSPENSFGKVDDATRQSLKELSVRIEKQIKK